MKCGCSLESVKLVDSADIVCKMHGRKGRSHNLTFAFAMSVEEAVPGSEANIQRGNINWG